MKAVIQRVKKSSVKIDGEVVSKINKGLLVLFAVHVDDDKNIEKIADKIVNMRIFSDEDGKMNLSVKDIGGEVLLVSQFTLYADTRKGNRPSFINSAKPDLAIPVYERLVEGIRARGVKTETGEFGKMMDVDLVNDGPVTIILEI